MDDIDAAQRSKREQDDPERAVVTALERAERAMPGSLTQAARDRIELWRAAELARKVKGTLGAVILDESRRG